MNTAEWRFWPEGDFRVVTDAELASPLPLVFPFRVSFDPEDLRIEGNPFRVSPSPFYGEGDRG